MKLKPAMIYLELPGEEFKYGYTLADWLKHHVPEFERMQTMIDEHQRDIYQLRALSNIMERKLDSIPK
jgi:hypothetical protein